MQKVVFIPFPIRDQFELLGRVSEMVKSANIVTIQYREKLWKYDLPHIGALYRRVRESRGVRPAEIARFCGVAEATISRNLEEQGKTGSETFNRAIAALQSDIAQPPLTQQQARMLHTLYRHSKEKGVHERQCELAALNLDQVNSKQRPRKLDSLVAQLAQEQRPALLMDQLWFIHALNGMLLHLFGTDSSADFFRRWDAWHVIGGLLSADSPIRRAHVNTDEFFPPMVALFFTNEHTYPYLFTLQMRLLIKRLHELSEENNAEFTEWWLRANSFNLPYNLQNLTRTILYQGEPIQVEARLHFRQAVEVEAGHRACYTLLVWNPLGSTAHKAFEQMQRLPQSSQIFYAADFDTAHDFYVNEWPEVAVEIDGWGCL